MAVEASIQIARAFVKLREVLAANKELARRLEAIESQLAEHHCELGDHAGKIAAVLDAIHRLMGPPQESGPLFKPNPRIGFNPGG